MTIFNAAVIQMCSSTDVAENIDTLRDLVAKTADAGAHYVQTPEMTGLVQKARGPFLEAITSHENDPVLAAAAELAAEHHVHLHIGSTPVRVAEGRAANRAALFSPRGDLLAIYDKIHMFDVDLDNGESWRESVVYQPGEDAVLASLPDALEGVHLGMTICYDLRFPHLHRTLALAGANVLTGPSCFTRQTGRAHWHALLRSRAIETGSFMIAAAQGGDHEDGRETYGHSLIVDPWGEVIAEIDGEEPGIAMAEIDLSLSIDARRKVPNLANGRDFGLRLATEQAEIKAAE